MKILKNFRFIQFPTILNQLRDGQHKKHSKYLKASTNMSQITEVKPDCDEKIQLENKSITYNHIAAKLISDRFLLTALELHTELLESGKELRQLKDFFSNPGNFETIESTSYLRKFIIFIKILKLNVYAYLLKFCPRFCICYIIWKWSLQLKHQWK